MNIDISHLNSLSMVLLMYHTSLDFLFPALVLLGPTVTL